MRVVQWSVSSAWPWKITVARAMSSRPHRVLFVSPHQEPAVRARPAEIGSTWTIDQHCWGLTIDSYDGHRWRKAASPLRQQTASTRSFGSDPGSCLMSASE
jgi:hypothetical protein